MSIWITDPKTKERSVSLTLLTISFVALITACLFHSLKKIDNTSSLTELFSITSALYFGRRFVSRTGSTLEPSTTKEEQ